LPQKGLIKNNKSSNNCLTETKGGQLNGCLLFKKMENKRKKLTDPEEYAIVKSVYFPEDNINKEQIDPIEKLERMESKQKFNNKSSR